MFEQPPPLPVTSAAAPTSGTTRLRTLCNLYLSFFLLDGGVRLACVLLGDHFWLPFIKSLSFLAVNVFALLVIMLLGSYRHLPWRALLCTLAVSVWAGLFYIPLPGLLEWKNVEFVGAILGLVVGSGTLVFSRLGRGSWFLPESAFEAAEFSWAFTARVAFVETVLLVPACIVYVAVCLNLMLEWTSNNFLHLRMHGLTVEARTYEVAGKSVYLLPTVHIASPSFYKDLMRGLPAANNATLLPEGVTDRSGRMKTGLSYTGAAKSTGLSEQPDFTHDMPGLVRHFDADVVEFSESTLLFLNAAARSFEQTNRQDWVGALATLNSLPPADFKQLKHDIIDLRNAKVVTGIAESLRNSNNVLVPWGAAHMPGIEQELLNFQLKKVSSRELTVLEWRKLIPKFNLEF